MSNDTNKIKAVKGAISKWDKPVVRDEGGDNCPLCTLYTYDSQGIYTRCEGCPVAELAGTHGCKNTPYIDWQDHHRHDHGDIFPYETVEGCDKCKKLQQAELEFLHTVLLHVLPIEDK